MNSHRCRFTSFAMCRHRCTSMSEHQFRAFVLRFSFDGVKFIASTSSMSFRFRNGRKQKAKTRRTKKKKRVKLKLIACNRVKCSLSSLSCCYFIFVALGFDSIEIVFVSSLISSSYLSVVKWTSFDSHCPMHCVRSLRVQNTKTCKHIIVSVRFGFIAWVCDSCFLIVWSTYYSIKFMSSAKL